MTIWGTVDSHLRNLVRLPGFPHGYGRIHCWLRSLSASLRVPQSYSDWHCKEVEIPAPDGFCSLSGSFPAASHDGFLHYPGSRQSFHYQNLFRRTIHMNTGTPDDSVKDYYRLLTASKKEKTWNRNCVTIPFCSIWKGIPESRNSSGKTLKH